MKRTGRAAIRRIREAGNTEPFLSFSLGETSGPLRTEHVAVEL